MSHHDSLHAELHARGLRLTPQRQLIADLLKEQTGHITVEQIYEEVHRRFPAVNRSTIYRTLEVLEDLGLVSHTHLVDGTSRFHATVAAPHLHFSCSCCGELFETDDLSIGQTLIAELRERFGFHADLTHTALTGTCSRCFE